MNKVNKDHKILALILMCLSAPLNAQINFTEYTAQKHPYVSGAILLAAGAGIQNLYNRYTKTKQQKPLQVSPRAGKASSEPGTPVQDNKQSFLVQPQTSWKLPTITGVIGAAVGLGGWFTLSHLTNKYGNKTKSQVLEDCANKSGNYILTKVGTLTDASIWGTGFGLGTVAVLYSFKNKLTNWLSALKTSTNEIKKAVKDGVTEIKDEAKDSVKKVSQAIQNEAPRVANQIQTNITDVANTTVKSLQAGGIAATKALTDTAKKTAYNCTIGFSINAIQGGWNKLKDVFGNENNFQAIDDTVQLTPEQAEKLETLQILDGKKLPQEYVDYKKLTQSDVQVVQEYDILTQSFKQDTSDAPIPSTETDFSE